MEKQCTKCKKILPLDSFGKHSQGKLGLHPNCKECRSIQYKKYYEKNRDKELKRARKKFIRYYQKNKDKLNARRRKWYVDNREDELRKKKDWYKNNSDLAKKRSKEWKRNNPHKVREWIDNRRRLEYNSEGFHTPDEWVFIKELSGYKCLRCGGVQGELDMDGYVVKLSEDHIIPLSEGGTDYVDNIQPLCIRCNSSKGVKIIDYRPLEFIVEMHEVLDPD